MVKCKVCGKKTENCGVREEEYYCLNCDRKISLLALDFVMDWKGRKLALADLVVTYKPKWEALKLDARGFERLVLKLLLPSGL